MIQLLFLHNEIQHCLFVTVVMKVELLTMASVVSKSINIPSSFPKDHRIVPNAFYWSIKTLENHFQELGRSENRWKEKTHK
ncbi:hypothetical protein VNO77_17435 [Canavalia gladiata]|uniref:Uncharacterized protein n=1 Tax=Canavalia gladiata TaxID=3824 RepID=A0AAN9LJ22_CANGL